MTQTKRDSPGYHLVFIAHRVLIAGGNDGSKHMANVQRLGGTSCFCPFIHPSIALSFSPATHFTSLIVCLNSYCFSVCLLFKSLHYWAEMSDLQITFKRLGIKRPA